MMLDDTPAAYALLIWAAIALLCIWLGGPWWLLIALPVGLGFLLPWALAFVLVWMMRR